jgi:threonine dehydratase
MSPEAPTLERIRQTRERLGDLVDTTPVRLWRDALLERRLGAGAQVLLKEELFQRAGSFKPRGALSVMLDLTPEALTRGVTAVSAGNHAMAVAYAAGVLGTSAKVVMPKTANPFRVERCRSMGATVELLDDVHQAFARVKQIEREEGRTFVHPFEGPLTALGNATLGLELVEQAGPLDAVVVPIGGGGLIAGVAAAVKLASPKTQVFGVEPEGADTMHRSFAAGSPQAIDKVTTIADSLGAPHAAPYSFGLCRRFVDALVLVSDVELCRAMKLLFASAKLAVEPAGAAAAAALLGPLRERLAGRRVALVVCGANIDPVTYATHLAMAGEEGP